MLKIIFKIGIMKLSTFIIERVSRMNIFISGSMAYDRIMAFPGRFSDHILPDKIHVLNVCFTVNGLVEKYGGTAGNIAYNLTLLGENPLIIASIGRDYESYFGWLKKHNISTEGIKIIEDEFTASAYITTDKADNQITGFNPGAMKCPTNYKFDYDGHDGIKNSIAIISPGNLQDMMRYANTFKQKTVKYICDPGQSITQWEREELIEWIKDSFLLIANDYELELIMKISGCDKKGLLNLTKTLITTLGENGSHISTYEGEVDVPAAKIAIAADPTGAGDAYRAGLIKGLIQGRDIETSAKMGAVSATYAIENHGTQEHSYTYPEFLERYKSNFGELV